MKEDIETTLIVTNQGQLEVMVLFRAASMIVHQAVGSDGYTISTDRSGFGFEPTFLTEAGAVKYARYLARSPLANVAQVADMLEIAKPVRDRAKRYARDIRRRERAIWNL
jgi:hypothetical protein